MAIDYTNSGFALPKSRPKALDKEDRDKALAAKDKAESAKARKRANGQCEVRVQVRIMDQIVDFRCCGKDTETHHLLGGIGRRNKGKSILAEYKLRVCAKDHYDITHKKLRPTTAEHDAYTVRYWRAK